MTSEVEVLAHHDALGAEAVHEHTLDEIDAATPATGPASNGNTTVASTPVAASSSMRLLVVGEQLAAPTRAARPMAGWRSNVTTAERAPSLGRDVADLGDHGLVAEVYAVVGADRDDGALPGERCSR